MIYVGSNVDAVETLELFNEKAEEFLSSRFFARVRGGGAIVEFSRDSGWDAVHIGPDEESTRALVLTLRLFMQDNDRLSLCRMAALYDALPLSDGVAREFDRSRSALNSFLDSDSPLAIEEGRCLTHREILEIFVYGAYAHVEPQSRRIYEDLRTTPFYPLFQKNLVDACVAFARCVSAVRETNRRAVIELTAGTHDTVG